MPASAPKAILFDFDGTVSLLRNGWEAAMRHLCLEVLGDDPSTTAMVDEYIADSTSIQTILQMEWLQAEASRRGMLRASVDAWALKAQYNRLLMETVAARRDNVLSGRVPRERYLVKGAAAFLEALHARGVPLYIASGTDEADVRQESEVLGVAHFFDRIAGALLHRKDCGKEAVLRWLVAEKGWQGTDLVVIGDGKVEIRLGREIGARTIGVASDESGRGGMDEQKEVRLVQVGADLLVRDYADLSGLLGWLGY
jgi:phosphoglycolate phosphatase-like HAD superfamily hydrolase